jgi:hypothetical protein
VAPQNAEATQHENPDTNLRVGDLYFTPGQHSAKKREIALYASATGVQLVTGYVALEKMPRV